MPAWELKSLGYGSGDTWVWKCGRARAQVPHDNSPHTTKRSIEVKIEHPLDGKLTCQCRVEFVGTLAEVRNHALDLLYAAAQWTGTLLPARAGLELGE